MACPLLGGPLNRRRGMLMTKSELIEILAQKQKQLAFKDVELAVKTMLEHMALTLATGERIEIHYITVHPEWGATQKPVTQSTWKRSMFHISSRVRKCVSVLMKVCKE